MTPSDASPEALQRLDAALGLHRRGALAEAEAAYLAILRDHPRLAAALQLLGTLYAQQGRRTDAIEKLEACLAVEPDNTMALGNYAGVLMTVGRVADGLAILDRLLARPDQSTAERASLLRNRTMALRSLGRIPEAASALREALSLAPDPGFLEGLLWILQRENADWTNLDALQAFVVDRVLRDPSAILAGDRLSLPDPAVQKRAAENWARSLGPPVPAPSFHRRASRDEPIRIGYFSADFYHHATLLLMMGLFERHDRSRFDVTAYAYGGHQEDALTARLKQAVDAYVDINRLTDAEAAELARSRRTDVAIDAKGAFSPSRFRIFAHRAAPVQVGFLAFAGTMGAEDLDYVIADRTVIPPDQVRHYVEKTVWLPDTYFVASHAQMPEGRTWTREECGLPPNDFVFCCFNQTHKITPHVFDIWMRILLRTPGSLLWLLDDHPATMGNLRREASARGVDPERLVFAGRAPSANYISRMSLADLFLDTLPYNAHTTAADALYAGLPVLTRLGETFAGRAAGSIVKAGGLPELVVDSDARYEQLAVELAQDRKRARALKRMAADARATSPLFDTERYVQNFEAALQAMVARHESGAPPARLSIGADRRAHWIAEA